MIIAFDIDDVIADTLQTFINYYNGKYRTKFRRRDFSVYHWWKVLGISFDEFKQIFYEFVASGAFEKMPLITGAKEGIEKLKKHHDLVLITARQNELEKTTQDWVAKNFPETFSEIYYSSSDFEPDENTKVSACWQGAVDILVEDQYFYAKMCVDSGISALLYDSPWNKNEILIDNMDRVYSWPDIIKKIKNQKYGKF